jgi:hypothetical protein
MRYAHDVSLRTIEKEAEITGQQMPRIAKYNTRSEPGIEQKAPINSYHWSNRTYSNTIFP